MYYLSEYFIIVHVYKNKFYAGRIELYSITNNMNKKPVTYTLWHIPVDILVSKLTHIFHVTLCMQLSLHCLQKYAY